MISILILSWNRPFHLLLTLISVFRILNFTKIHFEILILDQNSNFLTKKVISFFRFNKTFLLNENCGMANGWARLYESVDEKANYILQLENDWWCNSRDSKFLDIALNALEKDNCAFVKLRKNFDFQAGMNMINKEPQTIYPLPFNIFEFKKIGDQFCLYSDSKYACFTFNPTLMKVNFRKEMEASYVDNFNSNLDLLRSGEDLPTEYWEKQNFWQSAIISNSPFVHTGFHSRRYIYLKMPVFYLIECYWWLVRFYNTFRKST